MAKSLKSMVARDGGTADASLFQGWIRSNLSRCLYSLYEWEGTINGAIRGTIMAPRIDTSAHVRQLCAFSLLPITTYEELRQLVPNSARYPVLDEVIIHPP